jgi:hypothetical protein
LYCKILSQVITAVKEVYYNKYISGSDTKPRAMWNTVKTFTGNKNNHNEISHINNILTDNCQLIVNSFNTYFLTVTDKIVSDIPQYSDGPSLNINPLDYLSNVFKQPFPNIQFKNTSTKEIEIIITSLTTKNSCGYDEISNKILKISMPFITSPLIYIYM